MTDREKIISLVSIFVIFVLGLLLYSDSEIMTSSSDYTKSLIRSNKELINREKTLYERIKEDSLIIVDLKNKRSDVQIQRKKREKKFNETLDVIASTDSITDLLIGADIIRESHKDRLAHR